MIDHLDCICHWLMGRWIPIRVRHNPFLSVHLWDWGSYKNQLNHFALFHWAWCAYITMHKPLPAMKDLHTLSIHEPNWSSPSLSSQTTHDPSY